MKQISQNLLKIVGDNALAQINLLISAFDAMPGVTLIITQKGDVLDVFSGTKTKLSGDDNAMIGKNLTQIFPVTKSIDMLFSIENSIGENQIQTAELELEIQNQRKLFQCRVSPLLTAETKLVVWFAQEVELPHQQHKTATTSSENHRFFNIAGQIKLEKFLENENRFCFNHRLHSALVYINIDDTDKIDNQLGSDADEVFNQITTRIENQTRQRDFWAKLERGVFAFVFPAIADTIAEAIDESANITLKIKQMLSVPLTINNNAIQISISTGIVILPQMNKTAREIIRDAKQAMNARLDNGKGYLTTYNT